MLWWYFFLYLIENARSEYFDSYRGVVLTKEQIKKYQNEGNLQYCATDIKLPCDPEGWRPLDGSCNNLKHPSYGTVRTPTLRLLEPIYGKDLRDRTAEDGKELPLVRPLRTHLLKEGKASDSVFTLLMTYFILYSFTDNGPIQDTLNYGLYTTYCCEPRGQGDYMCTPHKIPEKDPVHRFSHVRCMNQTRPITFQTYGCLKNGTTFPARINTETVLYDLSSIYYFQGRPAERTLSGGELAVDKINDKIWPVQNNAKDTICVSNQGSEDLCFKGISNGVLGGTFMSVLLFRQHNYIAKELAALNPCWSDEKLFYTARDINIAIETQIIMYELMAELLGKKNLIKEGVLSCSLGHRDLYDEGILPQASEEYFYSIRWFHIVQETDIKLYNKEGHYTKTFPMTNLTLRPGFLSTDHHIEEITQSSFRQPCGKFDHTVDPAISERGFGPIQYSLDIIMNDLAKGRQTGFQGYIKYREYCSGKKYKTFEDLHDVMDQDRIYMLKEMYKALGDIDLLAGLWSEWKIQNGNVPHTMYCFFVDQLKRFIKSDRFWYERPNRPHAFTDDQLREIRKIKIAKVLCNVGDSVKKIQKHAFLRISPTNPLMNCEDIPGIDFGKWKDEKCENFTKKHSCGCKKH